MVPPVRLCLVGGYLKEGTSRKDIDINGVLSENDFDLAFGYTHTSLQEAYKDSVRSEKFKRYIQSNTVTGWALSGVFGKHVDFKWIPSTMLYTPYADLNIELDVTDYIDECNIHLQR